MVKETEKSTWGEKYVAWNRITGYPLLAIGILASSGVLAILGGVNVVQAEVANKIIKKRKKRKNK